MIFALLVVALCAAVMFCPPIRKKFDFLKDNGVFRVAVALVISRLLLLLFAYVVMSLRHGGNVLDLLKENGDIPHFIHLAQYGYSVGDQFENLIVFYPLFPLCMRLGAYVFGDYYISGLVISNVCSVVAGCFLYKLVRVDEPEGVARDSVVFLMLYPFAFFMLFAYTEGLFIMLCVMCAYYARKGKWIVCGVIGALAAMTRVQGVIMFGFAVYEYIVQVPKRSFKEFISSLSPKGAALLLIPAGLGVYLFLNWFYFGNALKFMEFQAAPPWYNGAAFFAENLAQHVNMAIEHEGLSYIIYIPQLVIFFLSFALVIYGAKRKVRTSYLLHICAYTLVSYTSSWLISGPRYMLSCIFLCVPLARLAENKAWRAVLITAESMFFFFYFVAYLFKHAIM